MRSVSLKSAIGLLYLSIMTSVCPASNREQAIARVWLPEAACRDYRVKIEACATVNEPTTMTELHCVN